MDDSTKTNKYEPTPTELKLLEALCTPDNATKSITDICNQSKISRNAYYDAMAKQGFKELLKVTSLELVISKLVPVINATIKFAVSIPQCSADRKVLLQMADMIAEKSEIKTNQTINITEGKTKEELNQMLIDRGWTAPK